MSLRFFICVILVNISRVRSHSCITPNGGVGECKSILECEALRRVVNMEVKPLEEKIYLKNSTCGYHRDIPKVCCLAETPKCFTPDGKAGECVGLYFCPHLMQKLKNNISSEDYAFIEKSRCSGAIFFSVCCAPPTPVTLGIDEQAPAASRGGACPARGLPSQDSGCCGINGVGGNKIHGGSEAGIDQYPWLALVEFRKADSIDIVCGGSLITTRHVLSAAHCFVKQERLGEPHSVRLGEHDTSHAGADCVEVDGGGTDCNDEPVRVLIASVTPHAHYQHRQNDIALVRLATPAPYTAFIHPVCLPTSDIAVDPPAHLRLVAAGWGAVDVHTTASPVKLQVDLPYQDIKSCEIKYKHKVSLWAGQLCAGGEPGKDSCKGDSGGPLMHFNGSAVVAVGVISYGTTPCGILYPGVYTNVYQYMDWIKQNISD